MQKHVYSFGTKTEGNGKMKDTLGQNVMVELKPGAGGNIGAEYVARSRPDGYTVLYAGISLSTNVSLMKLGFDPRHDLVPVGGVAGIPHIVGTSAEGPFKTLKDLVGQARQPGTYAVSSLSTLVNALFASGGPNTNGSMRQIELKRGGKTVTTFDLYEFISKGDKTRDVSLQAGDVITTHKGAYTEVRKLFQTYYYVFANKSIGSSDQNAAVG